MSKTKDKVEISEDTQEMDYLLSAIFDSNNKSNDDILRAIGRKKITDDDRKWLNAQKQKLRKKYNLPSFRTTESKNVDWKYLDKKWSKYKKAENTEFTEDTIRE